MTSEEILRDHSESAVRDAIEENQLIFLGSFPGGMPRPYVWEMYRGEDMMRSYTGIPRPMFNGVYALRLDEKNLEKEVSETVEFFRSRGVPHMWWVGPSSTAGIEELLAGHGLMKLEWDNAAMAIDLRQLNESKLRELSERSGADVKRINTEEDLDKWSKVFGAAFQNDELTYEVFHSVFKSLLEREACSFFLAEIDGEPVGGSSSALKAGVVGIYNVGTLEEHRGKGIGQLVSLVALHEAKNQGYEIGVLSSSELGFNVYQKLGFKEYFRYRLYVDIAQ
jgi:ribosomal protein S18 acetylase RimI-like enzyme